MSDQDWGFMEEGIFVPVPKTPLERAGYGPPPFTVQLPLGEFRHIITRPRNERSIIEESKINGPIELPKKDSADLS